MDIADLVEDGQAEVFPDARHGLQEGMIEHEGDAGSLAGVGEPEPSEHAFAVPRLRDQVVAIGGDELEDELEVVVFDVGVNELLALTIHDADVHLPRVEVDSAIVFAGGGAILHGSIQ